MRRRIAALSVLSAQGRKSRSKTDDTRSGEQAIRMLPVDGDRKEVKKAAAFSRYICCKDLCLYGGSRCTPGKVAVRAIVANEPTGNCGMRCACPKLVTKLRGMRCRFWHAVLHMTRALVE